MEQNEALNILIAGVRKGHDSHIYTLEETGAIYQAIQAFSIPVPPTPPPVEEEDDKT